MSDVEESDGPVRFRHIDPMSRDPKDRRIAELKAEIDDVEARAEEAEADLALTDGALESSVDDADEQRERAEKAEADLAVLVQWLRTATDGFSWPLTEHMDVQFCGRSMGDDAATLRRLLTEDQT